MTTPSTDVSKPSTAPQTTTNPAVASSTNPDGKVDAKGPQASGDQGLTTSTDTFVNPDIQALSRTPTSVGADGVERISGPVLDNWQPAASKATDEQIAAAEAHQKVLDQAAKDRAAVYGNSDVKEADKAPNVPGDGGSNPRTS